MSKDVSEYKSIRITFTLDKRTLDSLDFIAKETLGSKSSAVRLSVLEYVKKLKREQTEGS